SSITLADGAIPVQVDNLTLIGPATRTLAIDGAGTDRVFVHLGYGSFTIQDLTVRHGAARGTGFQTTGGGCLVSLGFLDLEHSTVTGCYSAAEGVYGGAIFAYNLTMQSSTLTGNVAMGKHPATGTASWGGGAYVAYATLDRSTVSGNSARHDAADPFANYGTGGGVFTNFGAYVAQSAVFGNDADTLGGGLASYDGIVALDSTISGNHVRSGAGGGLSLRLFYGATLSNTTITNNTAPTGGGVYARLPFQALTLQSTIVANNHGTVGADLAAASALLVDGANNLVREVDANTTLPPATLRSDPLLLPLAQNGGPTPTHALTIGSPAVDTGNNVNSQATDQRGAGFPRVVGFGPDIGAFEGALAAPVVFRPLPAPALSDWARIVLAGVLALGAAFAGGLRKRR
ncbi:MAG TPA: choice-of-anchor Q domain-containing protein, partial [Rudaea sp.]